MGGYPVSLSYPVSSDTYSKIARRFPGVSSKNRKKAVFSTFFGPKRKILRPRVAFLIIGTPSTTKWAANI